MRWLLADILADLDAAAGQLREQDKRLRTLLGNLARCFRKHEYAATKVGEFADHLSDDYWSDPRQLPGRPWPRRPLSRPVAAARRPGADR